MAASTARAQQGATAALDSKERSEALAQMHLTKILRAYIMQMITGACWERGQAGPGCQRQQLTIDTLCAVGARLCEA